MSRPAQTPIGLELAGVARDVGRAFDAELAQAGGSRPMWLVLLSLKAQPTANQRELAAAVGIQDATLTHHLNGMEADGLLTRRRDPANRRVHLVELTATGTPPSSASGPLRSGTTPGCAPGSPTPSSTRCGLCSRACGTTPLPCDAHPFVRTNPRTSPATSSGRWRTTQCPPSISRTVRLSTKGAALRWSAAPM